MNEADTSNVAPEVAEALAEGRGVVALESTLIAHGLPWPDNLETARAAEAAVRAAGALPATVAVLGGVIRVGLSAGELERVARSGTFLKASRRDLSAAVALGRDAATTVSATLWVAPQRPRGDGHGRPRGRPPRRGDDLRRLDRPRRAPCATVCSWSARGSSRSSTCPRPSTPWRRGGVPVVGYRTADLPAFTTVSSGLALDTRVESAGEAAAVVRRTAVSACPGPSCWRSRSRQPRRSTATSWKPRCRPRWTRPAPGGVGEGRDAVPARPHPPRHRGPQPPRQPCPDRGQRPPGRRDGGGPRPALASLVGQVSTCLFK